MRQAFAFVLLLVFGFYHVGYYGVYLIANYQTDHYWQSLTQQAEISENGLLYMAVPLAIPYQRNQTEYEPGSGKVEANGNYYRVIKQKYANDTLHILYKVDTLQQEIEESVDTWISSLLSIPDADSDSVPLWKWMAKDFLLRQDVNLMKPIRLLYYQSLYGEVCYSVYEPTLTISLPPPEVV